MSPHELLAIVRKAHALVADAQHWTGENFAEDDTGHWVPVGSVRATRFNLAGALIKGAGSSAREAIGALERVLADAPAELNAGKLTPSRGLTRTQALALLDWAVLQLGKVDSEHAMSS
jgi:hypothetical protein